MWNHRKKSPTTRLRVELSTGAGKRTWTSTKLPPLEPESSASANSAIPAYWIFPSELLHWPKKRNVIPSEPQRFNADSVCWCEKRDLNPYGIHHTPLKRARLPVPPLSHTWNISLLIIPYFLKLSTRFFKKVDFVQSSKKYAVYFAVIYLYLPCKWSAP